MVEYRKKIKARPIIKSGDAEDSKGYQRFHNFLPKSESITQSGQWNQLDTPYVISMLLAKLPGHTRDKWVRRVLSIKSRQMREPDLVDFIEPAKDETLLVNDPLFSTSAIDQYCDRPPKGSEQNPTHKRNNLITYVTMVDSTKTKGLELYVFCEKKHPLDKSESIKPLNEWIKILRKGKRCYECLKPITKDNNTKNCQQRLTCRIRAFCHPTILCGYVPKV